MRSGDDETVKSKLDSEREIAKDMESSESESESESEDKDEGVDTSNAAAMASMLKALNHLYKEKKERKRLCDVSGISVGSIASYTDGLDMAKWLRTLEADLTDLRVKLKHWKRILAHKLSTKAKEAVVDVMERKDCTYVMLKDACLRMIGSRSCSYFLTREFLQMAVVPFSFEGREFSRRL